MWAGFELKTSNLCEIFQQWCFCDCSLASGTVRNKQEVVKVTKLFLCHFLSFRYTLYPVFMVLARTRFIFAVARRRNGWNPVYSIPPLFTLWGQAEGVSPRQGGVWWPWAEAPPWPFVNCLPLSCTSFKLVFKYCCYCLLFLNLIAISSKLFISQSMIFSFFTSSCLHPATEKREREGGVSGGWFGVVSIGTLHWEHHS